MQTKTYIDERSTGHTRFKQDSNWRNYDEAWKCADLQVRRVKDADRDETQIEMCIERCVKRKGLRVYTALFSFVLKAEDAKKLALTIYPELAEKG